MNDITIRGMEPSDYPFVKSTWLKNYRAQSDFAKPIRTSVYFGAHAKIADHILSRAETLVAVHVNEPDVILGFIVFEPHETPVVHYTYVIEKARRLGIGRELFQAAGIGPVLHYTHRTRDAKALSARFPEMTYNPYLL